MTLIVGIKCSNGIVVGADGAATLGVLGQNTALQPVKKLQFIKGDTILGVSGAVGISQQMAGLLGKITYAGAYTTARVMTDLRKTIWDNLLRKEFEVAEITRRLHPNMMQDCMCMTVLALPVGTGLELIQFNSSGAAEAATSDLPFVSIGSGQTTADPFLAFIRRIFWKKENPTVADGIFAAWWTLHHAIKISPGGVADPKQIAILEMKDKKPIARELSDGELREHEEAVHRAERHLETFDRNAAAAKPIAVTAEDIPSPPAPPPK